MYEPTRLILSYNKPRIILGGFLISSNPLHYVASESMPYCCTWLEGKLESYSYLLPPPPPLLLVLLL